MIGFEITLKLLPSYFVSTQYFKSKNTSGSLYSSSLHIEHPFSKT